MHEFLGDKKTLYARYFGWTYIPLFIFLILPIMITIIDVVSDRELLFLQSTFWQQSHQSVKLESLALVCIVIHLSCYFGTQGSVRKINVLDRKIRFLFFNGKVIEINFSDIDSFEYTEGTVKNFEFYLKDKTQHVIPPTIQNKDQAYSLIEERVLSKSG